MLFPRRMLIVKVVAYAMTECQRGPDSPCAISKPLSSICPEPMSLTVLCCCWQRHWVVHHASVAAWRLTATNCSCRVSDSCRLGRTLKCASARDECRRTEPLPLCLWVVKDGPLKAQADSELEHPFIDSVTALCLDGRYLRIAAKRSDGPVRI